MRAMQPQNKTGHCFFFSRFPFLYENVAKKQQQKKLLLAIDKFAYLLLFSLPFSHAWFPHPNAVTETHKSFVFLPTPIGIFL